jgi:hypothetical protein
LCHAGCLFQPSGCWQRFMESCCIANASRRPQQPLPAPDPALAPPCPGAGLGFQQPAAAALATAVVAAAVVTAAEPALPAALRRRMHRGAADTRSSRRAAAARCSSRWQQVAAGRCRLLRLIASSSGRRELDAACPGRQQQQAPSCRRRLEAKQMSKLRIGGTLLKVPSLTVKRLHPCRLIAQPMRLEAAEEQAHVAASLRKRAPLPLLLPIQLWRPARV